MTPMMLLDVNRKYVSVPPPDHFDPADRRRDLDGELLLHVRNWVTLMDGVGGVADNSSSNSSEAFVIGEEEFRRRSDAAAEPDMFRESNSGL